MCSVCLYLSAKEVNTVYSVGPYVSTKDVECSLFNVSVVRMHACVQTDPEPRLPLAKQRSRKVRADSVL